MNIKQLLIPKNLYQIFLHIVIVFLGVEIIVMDNTIKALRENIERRNTVLEIGDTLKLNDLISLTTNSKYSITNKRKFVFVFSTQCIFCTQTIPVWKKLIHSIDTSKIEIIGISLSSKENTQSYVSEHQFFKNLYYVEDFKNFAKRNEFQSTPITLSVNQHNVITELWFGVIKPDQIKNITHHFN